MHLEFLLMTISPSTAQLIITLIFVLFGIIFITRSYLKTKELKCSEMKVDKAPFDCPPKSLCKMNKGYYLGLALLCFIAVCFFIEYFGNYWTKETVSTWYPSLIKPSWTPPDAIFGPVWSVLYIMIAVSGWLIYRSDTSKERSSALFFYTLQLFLNFIWSFLFFSLRSPLWALIDIIPLCLLIMMTIYKAWSVDKLASFILLPYLLWVMYASSLNLFIWFLNKIPV